MKITSALGKIPWLRVLSYLPGIIGLSGELLNRDRESENADVLKQLDEQQKVIAESVTVLESRIKLVFWISATALVIAMAALAVALLR